MLLMLMCFIVLPLQAHQQRPAIISITFEQSGSILLQVQTNAEALLAKIGAQHENTDDAPQVEFYRELRELSPEELVSKFALFEPEYKQGLNLQFSGQPVNWSYVSIQVPEVGDVRKSRQSVIEFSSKIPTSATTAVWSYDQSFGDAVVSFISEGQVEKTTHWLVKGELSPEYRLDEKVIPRSTLQVSADYVELGYLHILPKGLDHILFVLGLFLLSRQLGPLLWQVTAFTIAHSITLALSIYGIISLSSSIVEPLIALSIAYVGIENLLTRQLMPWRVVIVFLFGLLHGMGFAGVLTELGLPESEFVTALITFNVGVELGQLSVILLAFTAVFWLRGRDDLYRKVVVIPGSLGITLMGLFWTVQRLS